LSILSRCAVRFGRLPPIVATSGCCARSETLPERPPHPLCPNTLPHYAFETRTRDRPGRRPTQIFIHNFDLAPSQLLQAILHGILQLLTFQIVTDLVWGGLATIQNRLSLKMVWLDLSLIARPFFAAGDVNSSDVLAQKSRQQPFCFPSDLRRQQLPSWTLLGWMKQFELSDSLSGW
jgi:hypothetical protein